jgi:hypothetical protein
VTLPLRDSGLPAALFVAAAALLLLRMHRLPSGLDPVRDAVSDYGATRFHAHYRVMVVLVGAGAALLAVALGRDTDAANLVWLWLYAGSRIAIAGFMIDREAPPYTTEGRIHWLLAVAAFASIAIGASTITWTGEPASLPAVGYAVAATAIATLVTQVMRSLRPVFGLVERLLYLAIVAWLLIAALGA